MKKINQKIDLSEFDFDFPYFMCNTQLHQIMYPQYDAFILLGNQNIGTPDCCQN